MTKSVYLGSNIWTISPENTLRYTPIRQTQWHIVKLSPQPVALTCCEEFNEVYVACRDGSVYALDAQTAEIKRSSPSPLHEVPLCLLTVWTENSLFIGLDDGAVVRLHLNTLTFDCMLGNGVEHSSAVYALDADERFLYSGGDDAIILVWDLNEANAVREISLASGPIRSVLRVEATIWIGLVNGTVEVLEIFGEDTNRIECISKKVPHNSAVVSFVKVGEHEVWSIAETITAEPHVEIEKLQVQVAPERHGHNSNIAMWDSRDFTFSMSKPGLTDDIISVTVINRVPFEEVSIMALSNSQGPQYVSTKARGLSIDESVANTELRVLDLEHQLADATDEIVTLRASGCFLNAFDNEEDTNNSQDGTCLDQLPIPTTNSELFSHVEHAGRGENNDLDEEFRSETHFTPVKMKKSHCEYLKSSLHRLSEFLVSLLADEVLSETHEAAGGVDMRNAIASITKELDYGKQLVDLCEMDYSGSTTSSVHDENDPGALRTPQKYENPRKTITRLQRRLEEETDKYRRLEKKHDSISRERILFADEAEHLKSQSDRTMSSYEDIIRDRTASSEGKNSLICELRQKVLQVEKDCSHEKKHREHIQKYCGEEIEGLTKAAEENSRIFEKELKSCYDSTEKKSIQIQSQKDMLRATERQVESLKNVNQALEVKCENLEKETVNIPEKLKRVREENLARIDLLGTEYNTSLSVMEKQYNGQLESLRESRYAVDGKNSGLRNDVEKERRTSDQVLTSIKLKLAQTERDLHSSRSRAEALNTRCRQRCIDLETSLQDANDKLSNKQESWEFKLGQVQHEAERSIRDSLCQRDAHLKEKNSIIENVNERLRESKEEEGLLSISIKRLRVDINDLQTERNFLLEEVEHRRNAETLFQAEASNLKKAGEELRASVHGSDAEVKSLRVKLDQLSENLRSRDIRIKELESKINILRAYEHEETGNSSDIMMARNALLDSANGEVEQLCEQIEILHRTREAQEKELRELRELVSLREETIRLKNATIESLTSNHGVEPLESPGLSLNVTPIAYGPLSSNRSAMLRMQAHGTVASWMGRNTTISAQERLTLNHTLQDLQEGVAVTQERLRSLTNTALKHKRLARLHLEVLPILHELERELFRISRKEPKLERELGLARGVVQSAIAQYYTNAEKQALLHKCDESLYKPSPKRFVAMMDTLAAMQRRRTGVDIRSRKTPSSPTRSAADTEMLSTNGGVAATQATRRLLIFQ